VGELRQEVAARADAGAAQVVATVGEQVTARLAEVRHDFTAQLGASAAALRQAIGDSQGVCKDATVKACGETAAAVQHSLGEARERWEVKLKGVGEEMAAARQRAEDLTHALEHTSREEAKRLEDQVRSAVRRIEVLDDQFQSAQRQAARVVTEGQLRDRLKEQQDVILTSIKGDYAQQASCARRGQEVNDRVDSLRDKVAGAENNWAAAQLRETWVQKTLKDLESDMRDLKGRCERHESELASSLTKSRRLVDRLERREGAS